MEAKCLIILPAKEFNDQEYQSIREILDSVGALVKVASSASEIAIGLASMRVYTDTRFDSVGASDFEAVILIGGPGVYEYFNDSSVLDIVRQFYKAGKLVAAIGRSVEVLARAGILAERSATIRKDERNALLSRDISYSADEVTVDRNVITAAGAAYAHKFTEKIVEFLKI